ncbi:MAG: hypothetical protein M5U28_04800 [Sandaracinaceae bacterium]|nr:hypothetical protein [Sandaracinaceae bacterium]
MRIAVYVLLIALAVAAVAAGHLALALAVGGAKAALVGIEYMELRRAARLHALAFVLGMAALTGALVLLTGGA